MTFEYIRSLGNRTTIIETLRWKRSTKQMILDKLEVVGSERVCSRNPAAVKLIYLFSFSFD